MWALQMMEIMVVYSLFCVCVCHCLQSLESCVVEMIIIVLASSSCDAV